MIKNNIYPELSSKLSSHVSKSYHVCRLVFAWYTVEISHKSGYITVRTVSYFRIERQRQLAQLQQAGQNPNLVVNQQSVQNQQPNQAGQQQPNQAGEQQPNQAGEQQLNQAGEQQQLQANQQPGDQGNQQVGPPAPQDQIKADDGKNLINEDIQLGPGVKVYPTEDNKQPFFQPRVGMQVGNVNENEAGDGQREAGSLGSLVDRLGDQKGDTGLLGDSIPVLPKPGAGEHAMLFMCVFFCFHKVPKKKIVECVNRVDSDEGAHYELSHLDLLCLHSILWILSMILLVQNVWKYTDVNFVFCYFGT